MRSFFGLTIRTGAQLLLSFAQEIRAFRSSMGSHRGSVEQMQMSGPHVRAVGLRGRIHVNGKA